MMEEGRRRPMGEQAVPQWGLHPWMDLAYSDPTFDEVAKLDEDPEEMTEGENGQAEAHEGPKGTQ